MMTLATVGLLFVIAASDGMLPGSPDLQVIEVRSLQNRRRITALVCELSETNRSSTGPKRNSTFKFWKSPTRLRVDSTDRGVGAAEGSDSRRVEVINLLERPDHVATWQEGEVVTIGKQGKKNVPFPLGQTFDPLPIGFYPNHLRGGNRHRLDSYVAGTNRVNVSLTSRGSIHTVSYDLKGKPFHGEIEYDERAGFQPVAMRSTTTLNGRVIQTVSSTITHQQLLNDIWFPKKLVEPVPKPG